MEYCVKPYLSEKLVKSDKIHLNENEELIESETAEVLNNFFSSNIKNIKNPIFRAILKYKNHPSIRVMKRKLKNAKFSFQEVINEKIEKDIRRLNKNKASQTYSHEYIH